MLFKATVNADDKALPNSGSKNGQQLAKLLPRFVWIFCLIISFIGLLISTKSSPLYPLNDWPDANAFFTMGKGMVNNKVLYRDLFDHKGPLLYLIYGLASLISPRTFLGVFVFEVFSFSFFLFYFYKILCLFCNTTRSIVYLPIIATLVLNLKCFVHGGSAEEFCLPLVLISLFCLLSYFRSGFLHPMSNGWIFDNGIIAGCILWVKFSFLGFWFGWILAILTCLLFKKQFQSILRSIIYFCLGMVISTLPWLIYFGINHSINDWISSYLLINITNYPVQMPLFGRIRFIFSAISGQVGVNPLFGMILWLGLLYLYLSKKIFTSALQRVLIVLLVLFFIIGIYGGGLRYLYYYLILAPLSIFGFIAFDQFIFEHPGFEMSLKTSLATFFVLLFLLSVYLANFQDNVYMLSWKKNDLVQYKFAELIEQSETPTLLEYGTLDLGFYTTTGIIPNCRFFIRQNLRQSSALPILEEQNRYIKDKLVEYIVTRQPVVNSEDQLEIPNLYENYYLLSTQDQLSEKVIYRYYLFKRID